MQEKGQKQSNLDIGVARCFLNAQETWRKEGTVMDAVVIPGKEIELEQILDENNCLENKREK